MTVPQINRLIAAHEQEIELLKLQRDETLEALEHLSRTVPPSAFDHVGEAAERHDVGLTAFSDVFGLTSGQPYDLS